MCFCKNGILKDDDLYNISRIWGNLKTVLQDQGTQFMIVKLNIIFFIYIHKLGIERPVSIYFIIYVEVWGFIWKAQYVYAGSINLIEWDVKHLKMI